MQQNGIGWDGMVWHGTAWHGMILYGMVWMGFYGMVFYQVVVLCYILMLSLLLFGCMSVQFPIECSLPWMLVEHVLQSPDVGLLETVLMPFDIYNDAADYALRVLKQRFLYDEIEAEVSQMPKP